MKREATVVLVLAAGLLAAAWTLDRWPWSGPAATLPDPAAESARMSTQLGAATKALDRIDAVNAAVDRVAASGGSVLLYREGHVWLAQVSDGGAPRTARHADPLAAIELALAEEGFAP